MLVCSLRRLAALAILLVGFIGRPAAAAGGAPGTSSDPRVVAIDVGPSVAAALVVALSPWSLTLVQAPGPIPPLDVGAAANRARAVATELHAGAVIWVAPSGKPEPRGSLWVYDAQTQQLAVRPLAAAAPFDAAGAAAVALSVKTILRASPLVTPERSGDAPNSPGPATPDASTAAAPSPPGANATAGPNGTAGPNAASGANAANNPTATRSTTAATAPGAESARAEADAFPRPHAAWRLETALGVRAPTGGGVEPRAVLGVSAWPAGPRGVFGLGVEVQAGAGVAVDDGGLRGELRRASLDVSGRLRLPLRKGLSIEGRGGAGLLLVSFDGQAQATGAPLTALRVDPTLDLGALVDLGLGARASLGAFVDASALLRVQHYALDGVPMLDEPLLVVFPGIRLSVEVD